MEGQSRRDTRQSVASIAATLALLAVVVGLLLTMPKSGTDLTASPDHQVDVTPTPWLHEYALFDESMRLPISVTEQVSWTHIVAVVTVSETTQAQFNTTGGVVPTKDPAFDTGIVTDTMGMRLYSLVTLEISTLYKSDLVTDTGYVLIDWGGSYDTYFHDVTNAPLFEEGQQGIAFLGPPPPPEAGSQPFRVALDAKVDEMNAATGGNYRAVVLHDYYYFDGENAISNFTQQSYTVADLISQIEAALGL